MDFIDTIGMYQEQIAFGRQWENTSMAKCIIFILAYQNSSKLLCILRKHNYPKKKKKFNLKKKRYKIFGTNFKQNQAKKLTKYKIASCCCCCCCCFSPLLLLFPNNRNFDSSNFNILIWLQFYKSIHLLKCQLVSLTICIFTFSWNI